MVKLEFRVVDLILMRTDEFVSSSIEMIDPTLDRHDEVGGII